MYKKKRYFIPLFILCGALSIFGLARLYFALTDDFSVHGISSNISPKPEWETKNLSVDQRDRVAKILDQKFTYLGKGCQTYVLESEDHQYVIKFFKFKHLTPHYWMEKLPLPEAIKNYQRESNLRREKKLQLLFNGYKIAYEDLAEETGTLLIHLVKSDNEFEKKLTIYDKLGYKHLINLNKTEFVLQKKAKMFSPEINTCAEKEKVKDLMEKMVDVLVARSKKGIIDYDYALSQNLGVLDQKVIIVDSGQFAKDETIQDPSVYLPDIKKRTRGFQVWLKDHYPDLIPEFERYLTQKRS